MRIFIKIAIVLMLLAIVAFVCVVRNVGLLETRFYIDINGLKKVSKIEFPEGSKITHQDCYSWLDYCIFARLEVPTESVAGLFSADNYTISNDSRCLTNKNDGQRNRWFRPDDTIEFTSVSYDKNEPDNPDRMFLKILYEVTNKPVTVMYLHITGE